jgi:hypothetical protein
MCGGELSWHLEGPATMAFYPDFDAGSPCWFQESLKALIPVRSLVTGGITLVYDDGLFQ